MAAAPSDLRVVIALSNHGSRAPHQEAAALCPQNQANLNAYSVPFEQLTDTGMQQMVHAGAHTRKVYVEDAHFLSPTLKQKNHFDSYFRAAPSLSCGQSSVTFGYGLYPETAPSLGFPVPVPVVMQLVPNEHDIAVTHGPCLATLEKDLASFARRKGKTILSQHEATIKQLGDACGRPLPLKEKPHKSIRILADMLAADKAHGLPLIVNPALYDDVQTLAFNQMITQYLGTPRQVTYYVGGFPQLMSNQLKDAAKPTNATSPKQYKLYSYNGHQELLHGVGLMLGWQFNFVGQPRSATFNTTALPAGTTMFFELHGTEDNAVVKTHIWSPETDRKPVKLAKCSSEACPLAEFNKIIENHVASTRTWQELCNYHPPSKVNGLEMTGVNTSTSEYSLVLGAVLIALTMFAMHSAYNRIRQFKRQSQYTAL